MQRRARIPRHLHPLWHVLLFFREPRKAGDAPPPSIAQVARNFCVVLGNAKLVLPVLLIALLLGGVSLFLPWGFTVPWWIWTILAALVLAGISRFMWFLVLFTGYWVVFWQQYISLPGYIHRYINANADVELILITDGLTVIALTLAVNYATRKIPAFHAGGRREVCRFRVACPNTERAKPGSRCVTPLGRSGNCRRPFSSKSHIP